MSERYITMWRKTDDVLDWDFHVSESRADAEQVVRNITRQGVHQYSTRQLGDKVEDLSSAY